MALVLRASSCVGGRGADDRTQGSFHWFHLWCSGLELNMGKAVSIDWDLAPEPGVYRVAIVHQLREKGQVRFLAEAAQTKRLAVGLTVAGVLTTSVIAGLTMALSDSIVGWMLGILTALMFVAHVRKEMVKNCA